jgi:hypothetical protein
MNDQLKRCLDDLENRIDPREEERLFQDWLQFSSGCWEEQYFLPQRNQPNLPDIDWPVIPVNDALEDFDKMALQQYDFCSKELVRTGGDLLSVRCNYGTSIIPLLFGVQPFIMDKNAGTLPTSHPLQDKSAIRRLVKAGIPDLRQGFGGRVLEMGERFAAIAEEYPCIGQYVHIYHPDLQGAMDICEIIWGSSLFLDIYDEPQLVHDFLNLIVETYSAFMQIWQRIHPPKSWGSVHWGMHLNGSIMLRVDSATNFSPRMVKQFILPYEQALLDNFGGGGIHFCGRGDHFIAMLSDLRGLNAVNMSQPELNDLNKIFEHTVAKGINLIGLEQQIADQALAEGIDLHNRVHCVLPK